MYIYIYIINMCIYIYIYRIYVYISIHVCARAWLKRLLSFSSLSFSAVSVHPWSGVSGSGLGWELVPWLLAGDWTAGMSLVNGIGLLVYRYIGIMLYWCNGYIYVFLFHVYPWPYAHTRDYMVHIRYYLGYIRYYIIPTRYYLVHTRYYVVYFWYYRVYLDTA